MHTQNAHLRPRAALHRHRYRSYKKNFESQARRDLSIGVISRPGVGISPPGARDGFIYSMMWCIILYWYSGKDGCTRNEKERESAMVVHATRKSERAR